MGNAKKTNDMCTVYGRAFLMWSIFAVTFVAYVVTVYYVVHAIDFSEEDA